MSNRILDTFDEIVEYNPQQTIFLVEQQDFDELVRDHVDLSDHRPVDLNLDPEDVDGKYALQYRGVPVFVWNEGSPARKRLESP